MTQTTTPATLGTELLEAVEVEDGATHARVLELLTSAGASFDTLTHAATRTSEESAAVRGVPLASGSKAMLLRAGKTLEHGSPFLLAVMSAAQSLSWSKIRKLFASSKLSMATQEEVRDITGCIPGAVPPFGSLFPGVKTVVDQSLLDQGAEINFNAGLRTVSVLHLPVAEYLRIEKPHVLSFT